MCPTIVPTFLPPPPICQILQAIGANYNKEVVEELDQLTCDAMRRSRESTTQQGTTTAVQKFLAFLADLGVPQAALTSQDRSSSNWSSDRWALHSALLSAYCSRVTKTQKTANTCAVYAGKVANTWHQAFGVELWPTAMSTELKPYIDGLFKIKMFVSVKREGINAADTLILCQTITAWARQRRRIRPRGPAHYWGGHFAATNIGLYQFANGCVFRYGEANCPAGKEFDVAYGITQGDVSIVKGVQGKPDIMRVKPPKYKVPAPGCPSLSLHEVMAYILSENTNHGVFLSIKLSSHTLFRSNDTGQGTAHIP